MHYKGQPSGECNSIGQPIKDEYLAIRIKREAIFAFRNEVIFRRHNDANPPKREETQRHCILVHLKDLPNQPKQKRYVLIQIERDICPLLQSSGDDSLTCLIAKRQYISNEGEYSDSMCVVIKSNYSSGEEFNFIHAEKYLDTTEPTCDNLLNNADIAVDKLLANLDESVAEEISNNDFKRIQDIAKNLKES